MTRRPIHKPGLMRKWSGAEHAWWDPLPCARPMIAVPSGAAGEAAADQRSEIGGVERHLLCECRWSGAAMQPRESARAVPSAEISRSQA